MERGGRRAVRPRSSHGQKKAFWKLRRSASGGRRPEDPWLPGSRPRRLKTFGKAGPKTLVSCRSNLFYWNIMRRSPRLIGTVALLILALVVVFVLAYQAWDAASSQRQ